MRLPWAIIFIVPPHFSAIVGGMPQNMGQQHGYNLVSL